MQLKLWEAATSGDKNQIRSLSKEDLLEVTADGNSMLHIAAKLGHLDLATILCIKCPPLPLLRNLKGDTPLHCASAAGHLRTVEFLFALSGNGSAIRNKAGNTALHEATRAGYSPVVRLLMSRQSGLAAVVNNAGISCLYMAAERGILEIVTILLRYPAASHVGPRDQTALHAAVLRSYDITRLILEKRPQLVKHKDATKSTPLHFAVAAGDLRMVQLLLRNDASVAYMQDEEGFSSIHVAASSGNLQVIEEILSQCPDSMEQKNIQGRNLLHIAVEKKILAVVKYAVQSSLLRELVNEQDNEGNTPLHLAVLSRHKKITRVLLDSGSADPGIMNSLGNTPVDVAFSNLKLDIGLRMYGIMTDLISHGSRFSPQRVDHIRNHLHRKKDEEINRYRMMANNLAIIAVLIATVTFAAAFTLPGGFKNDPGSDQGMAVLISKAAFRAFLISDGLAMASSITVVMILIHSGSLDHDVRLYSFVTAMKLLWVAVCAMIIAFATGVYVVVARDCEWVAILVSAIACGVPFAAILVTHRPSSLDYLSFVKLHLMPLLTQIRENTDSETVQLIHHRFNTTVNVQKVHPILLRDQMKVVQSHCPDGMIFHTPASSECTSCVVTFGEAEAEVLENI